MTISPNDIIVGLREALAELGIADTVYSYPMTDDETSPIMVTAQLPPAKIGRRTFYGLELVIRCSVRRAWFSIDIFDPKSQWKNRENLHPHVYASNGKMCSRIYDTAIENVREGDFLQLVMTAIQIAGTITPEDLLNDTPGCIPCAHVDCDRDHYRRCSSCNTPCCSSHLFKCGFCRCRVCKQCVSTKHEFEKHLVCSGHDHYKPDSFHGCNCCKKVDLIMNMASCDKCGTVVNTRCRKRCVYCDRERKMGDPSSPLLCNSCLHYSERTNYFFSCFDCVPEEGGKRCACGRGCHTDETRLGYKLFDADKRTTDGLTKYCSWCRQSGCETEDRRRREREERPNINIAFDGLRAAISSAGSWSTEETTPDEST